MNKGGGSIAPSYNEFPNNKITKLKEPPWTKDTTKSNTEIKCRRAEIRRRHPHKNRRQSMTDMTVRADNRTIYEATLDIRYGCRFNDMNARLYRSMDFMFGFIGLFGGSGALIAAIGGYKALGVIAGALIAAVAVIERLVRPIEKAVEHDDAKRRYADLSARASEITLQELDKELTALQANAPSGFSALEIPAYNANLLANGRPEYSVEASAWQKTIAFFA
jgi:hypothetical protein